MVDDILRDAVALAREGRKSEARWLLEQVLQADQTNETAWLLYAHCVEAGEEREAALQSCLRANPAADRARALLARLRDPLAVDYLPAACSDDDALGSTQPVKIRPAWAREWTEARTMVAVTGSSTAGSSPPSSAPTGSAPSRQVWYGFPETEWVQAPAALAAGEEPPAQESAGGKNSLGEFDSQPEPVWLVAPDFSTSSEGSADQENPVDFLDAGIPEAWGNSGDQGNRPDLPDLPDHPDLHDHPDLPDTPAQDELADPFTAELAIDPFADEAPVALFNPEDSLAAQELAYLDELMREEQAKSAVAAHGEQPIFTIEPGAISEDEFDTVEQRIETHLVQQGGPDRPPRPKTQPAVQDVDWSELEQIGAPRLHARRVPHAVDDALPGREIHVLKIPAKDRASRKPIKRTPDPRSPSSIYAVLIVSIMVLVIAMTLGVLIAMW